MPKTNPSKSPKSPSGSTFAERYVKRALAATPVEMNGPNPWDPQISNPKFYQRVLSKGSLGLGESYLDGWWDCAQLDEMLNLLLRSPRIKNQKFITHIGAGMLSLFFNLQKKKRAFQVGKKHYDIGNELYRAMLNERMVYTCGYWQNVDTLDDAQQQKLELVCRKLNLQSGMRVLDIGCGWGSFAQYAAEKYQVQVVGVTVSEQQIELGKKFCKGSAVELRLQDYRELNEEFDAIASIGMFEHVGHKNYRDYMRVAQRCLKKNGKFLLHTIGKNRSRIGADPWISKYIFPNGEIPSLKQITAALESLTSPLMVIEDLHNFGADYDKTLMAWFNNFDAAWPQLSKNLPKEFYRMWKYYLHVCAGAFRSRNLQLWQIVISNGAPREVYQRATL